MIFYDDRDAYLAGELARLEALRDANLPDEGVITAVLAPGRMGADGVPAEYPLTHRVEALDVDGQGILGDRHRCVSRGSSGRENSLYPKRTPIRQHRHLCAVSTHDCAVLSERLGVEITPELLGANLLVDRTDGGPYSLAELPSGTHLLVLPEGAHGIPRPPLATLVSYVQQRGCGITGRAIADRYGDKRLVAAFREYARDHRGLICSIEYPVDEVAALRAGQRVVFRYATGVVP